MPTENRSSNTEMVSVQAVHDLASKVREAMDRQACPNAWMVIAYEAVVKNFPAPAQHQGEPVAVVTIGPDDLAAIDLLVDSIAAGTKLYAHPAPATQQDYPSEAELIANGLGYPVSKEDAVKLHYAGYRSEVITILEAWEAIGHDIHINPDKQELLESLRNMAAICAAHGFDMPADPGEVERLRSELSECSAAHASLAEELRAIHAAKPWAAETKLAEAHALLREIHDGTLSGYQRWSKIEDLLNASAEPVSTAWRCELCKIEMADQRQCDLCSAEPVAPVERDERKLFEKAVIDKAERFHPDLQQYGPNADAEYRCANIEWAWGLWQARAALDRKP